PAANAAERPAFRASRIRRTRGSAARRRRATSALPSVEPSSTTITSAASESASRTGTSSPQRMGRLLASLKTGRTMDSSGTDDVTRGRRYRPRGTLSTRRNPATLRRISAREEDAVMAPERKGARPGQSAPDFTAVDTALKPVRLSAVARHAHLRHRDAALQPGGGQARLGRGGLDDQPRP